MRPVITLVLCALTVGCGGGTMNSSSGSANFTGTWQFTGDSTAFVLTFTGNGSLQQSGNSVTGQLSLSGSPCATSAALNGRANGTGLTFQLQEGNQAVSFTGTADSSFSSASGNYTAPAGGCLNGDMGTWTATKVSS